jgi:hypothetical protein
MKIVDRLRICISPFAFVYFKKKEVGPSNRFAKDIQNIIALMKIMYHLWR